MAKLTDIMQSRPGFASLGPVSKEEIDNAAHALCVRFCAEYREYVSRFGIASLEGHELTGVGHFPRLNFVDGTRKQRALDPQVPKNLYVIEELNMDCAAAWQSENGEVYLSQPGMALARVAASLAEYLEL